ncbi:MAG: hypothetical protein M3394_01525 [Actinomycetota bacterium]|nr:hypothetical protein [Actinomycetota bacterium]
MDRQANSNSDRAPAVDCVTRLAARGDDVRRALAGRALHVRLDYQDRRRTFGVLLTRDGHVLRVPADEPEPHVELRGTEEQVRGLLLGDVPLYDAVVSRVLVLHIEPDELLRCREILGIATDVLR